MKKPTFIIAWVALASALISPPARAQEADADGSALTAQTAMEIEPLPATEKFVPPAADIASFTGGTLILRGDATVSQAAIHLKNVCRWAESDAAFFTPAADLTITRMSGTGLYTKVTLDQVRNTLRDAGLNLALIRFGGAGACAVNRTQVQTDERQALDEWINSRRAISAAQTESPAAQIRPPTVAAPQAGPLRPLRTILINDFCGRLGLDAADLEMSFNSADEKVLNLAEPYFQFQIIPRRVRTLGDVAWDVVVVTSGQSRRTNITATARLWQTRAILTRPVGYGQIIRDEDLTEKRTLTENLSDERLLTKEQAVGQEAARELSPGATVTASMVEPVLLARPGQLITVNVIRGAVTITAVAKAIEGGSFGQTIRARGDVDPTEVFEVTLTGPQKGTVNSAPDDNKRPSPIAAAAN